MKGYYSRCSGKVLDEQTVKSDRRGTQRFRSSRFPCTPQSTSLCAGVSTLLTMMILHRRRDLGINRRTQILCYAFAPPPVFGPLNRVPAEAKKAIRSFVFRHDMVPRLSLANVYGLFRDLREVDTVGVGIVMLFVFDETRTPLFLISSSYATIISQAGRQPAVDSRPDLFDPGSSFPIIIYFRRGGVVTRSRYCMLRHMQ